MITDVVPNTPYECYWCSKGDYGKERVRRKRIRIEERKRKRRESAKVKSINRCTCDDMYCECDIFYGMPSIRYSYE